MKQRENTDMEVYQMKKQNKKAATVLAALLLSLSLAACGATEGGTVLGGTTESTTVSSAASESAGKESKVSDGKDRSENGKSSSEESSTADSAAGSESPSAGSEEGSSGTGSSESSGSEASNGESAGAAVPVSTVTVPEGFTERDFDGSYSDYVTVTLNGSSASADGSGVSVSGSTVTITEEGTYLLKGELEGQIVVDVADENAKVQLVLDGVQITNSSSAGIYVKNADKVFITLAEGSANEVSSTGSYVQTDENEVDAAIFSKDDLVINGSGSLTVTSAQGHGIVSKDDLKVTGGTIDITCAKKGLSANDMAGIAGGSISIDAGTDGIRADALVLIEDGTVVIDAVEGIESTVVTINGGDVTIYGYDDGINASQKTTDGYPLIEINGGTLTVTMSQGDTDALDSNGYLYIRGGTVTINAQFAFDFVAGGEMTGGEVYVNGQQVTSITNSMMGGGFGGRGQGGPGGFGGYGQQGGQNSPPSGFSGEGGQPQDPGTPPDGQGTPPGGYGGGPGGPGGRH